ncbi:22431_t:CDS:2 [Entrophospora sp. SA101]|nr:22431_t:CDS:2 [Entrophospora sp. SA101]
MLIRVDYDFLLKLQSLIIDWCIDGVILRNVYNQALDHLKSERPDLSDKFVRSLGHGIGTEFHESAYVLNSNSNKVFKNGMVLNLIVGFQNITNPKAKDDQTKNYSIWIIDTVKISDDTCHYMTDGNRNRDATTFFTEDKEDDENKKYTTTLFKDEERKEHQAELARQKQTDGLACLLEGKRDNMIEVHEQIVKLKKNSTKKEAEHILADVFNIKHLFFQPCDYELIVILHIHLINPIVFGKEKAKDIQFFRETSDAQFDETDYGKRKTKYVDEEEVGSELKDHRRQFLLNKSFKGFANKIAKSSNEKVHVDVPFRDIGFFGFPFKTNVLLQPTTDCLVHLVDLPFLVITMSDVEVVNLERIQHGFKNFDMVLIFKDYTRPPMHIDTIPMHQLEGVKEWMDSKDILFYEGTTNLNWAQIMRYINKDPVGFYNNGGWSFLHEKDLDSSSSDDYEESGGSDESGDEKKRKHSIDPTTSTNKKLNI